MSAAAIELRGITKWFGARQALAPTDLTVARGAFVALVGESGCGKTTLLRLVAGLEEPTAGTVLVDGAPVRGPREGVGFVFQSPVLLRWRTALENVLLPLQVAGRPVTPESRRRATALMERAGLGGSLHKLPRQLSGGMQARVALARALLLDPALLLLDEPFAALDALTRERMGQALLDLWHGRDLTVLFVTHDVAEAVYLADRVLVLAPGPGRLYRDFTVPLPRPRQPELRFAPAFVETCRAIRVAMAEVESAAVGGAR